MGVPIMLHRETQRDLITSAGGQSEMVGPLLAGLYVILHFKLTEFRVGQFRDTMSHLFCISDGVVCRCNTRNMFTLEISTRYNTLSGG